MADSIVRTVRDIDSLRMLQVKLEGDGDRLGSIAALRELGRRLRNESRFEEALRVHSEGLRQAEAAQDTLEWVQALNNIGTDYRRMGVLDAAQGYHYRAWKLNEETADTAFVVKKNRLVSLNGLGNIYLTLRNYDRADSVLRLALEGERELGSTVGQAINYANLGSIFEKRGRNDSAWVYYRKSMALNTEAGSDLGVALCHTYFGSLYEKEGAFDKAEREYETAYRMMRASKDEWHALGSLISLADISHVTGNEAKEKELLGRAEQVAEKIKSPEHLEEIHTLYYRHYKEEGDYRSALASFEKASAMRDSVLDMEKVNRIQNTSLNIERHRQEREMLMMTHNLEEERSARRLDYLLFSFVVLALAGTLATFFYIQRIQRKNHLALKKLSGLRENFFTNITHEFRTPLTLILGLSKELQRPGAEGVAKKAETIERQGKGLLALINQLLDISKIKSSAGNADWCHGDITAHIAMIVESWQEYARLRRIDLQFFGKEAVETDFVPEYANKTINNLLSNSLKFTPERGRVTVSVRREGDRLHIGVEDTGEGMDEKTLAHVFEPFYQGESEVRHIGTGVGLALVKQIVDAVGGTITAESAPGKGTAFSINVPISNKVTRPLSVEDALDMPLYAQSEEALQDTVEDDDRERLLVIEDHRDIASYIGSQFAGRYAVSYAGNGEDGLAKATEQVPDLIITDLMMPGMDGLEVCRRVRADEVISHIPIIVVTAKITEEDRIRGLEAGADAYLSKPFSATELRTRVRKLLEGRRMLREKYAGAVADGRVDAVQTSDPTTNADLRFLNKATDIVFLQLGQNKSVDVPLLASGLAMSPRQLHRKLVALTGYTPAGYIRRLKIKQAKTLIDTHPEMSFSEVADQAGFGDYSNFVRAFRDVVGVTPSEYRRGDGEAQS